MAPDDDRPDAKGGSFPVTAREADDHSPQPLIDDPEESVDAPVLTAPVDPEAMTIFIATLLKLLDEHKTNAKAARNEKRGRAGNFDTRSARNMRRSRAQVTPETDDDGRVKPQAIDGHATMGAHMGWSRQGSTLVSAFLEENLFENSARPFVVNARGDRHENATIERVGKSVMDDQLRRGKYKDIARLMTRGVPQHGTAILRYEMVMKRRTRRVVKTDAAGNREELWEEKPVQYQPNIQSWPLKNVIPTNLDMPGACDQEGVFWLTPKTTLAQLEGDDEVVIDRDEDGFIKSVEGKYRLEDIRRFEADSAGISNKTHTKDSASFLSGFELTEYEGALPLISWAKKGIITRSIMDALGVDIGIDVNPNDPRSIETWGRALQRIPVWRVFYTTLPGTSQSPNPSGGGHILLGFGIAPQRDPRNSMYVFRYQPDDANFLGQSLTDLGFTTEDAADGILNNVIWATWKNAHPSGVFNKSFLVNKSIEEVVKLLEKSHGLVECNGVGGARASDVLDLITLEIDPDARNKIALLKAEFEQTTGAKAAAKGTDVAGTGTLGEIELNLARSELELRDVLRSVGLEWGRLVTDIWRDLVWFMTAEEFVEYASEISGVGKSDLENKFPSLEGLGDDVEFDHPVVAKGDAAVLTTLLTRIMAAVPNAPWDVAEAAKRLVEGAGFALPDTLFLPSHLLNPGDENTMFAKGSWIDPDPREDWQNHILVHERRVTELQDGLDETISDEDAQLEFDMLSRHLLATISMVQGLLAAAEAFQGDQQGQQQQGLGPTRPGSAGANGGSNSGSSSGSAQAPQNQGAPQNSNRAPAATTSTANSTPA